MNESTSHMSPWRTTRAQRERVNLAQPARAREQNKRARIFVPLFHTLLSLPNVSLMSALEKCQFFTMWVKAQLN